MAKHSCNLPYLYRSCQHAGSVGANTVAGQFKQGCTFACIGLVFGVVVDDTPRHLPVVVLVSAVLCCATGDGFRYVARFPTRPNGKYCTIRLPWALFRAEGEGQPALDPSAVTRISLRYELRNTPRAPPVGGLPQQQQPQQPVQQPEPALQGSKQQPSSLFVPEGARLPAGAGAAMKARSLQLQQQRAQQAEQRFSRFKIEVDWIKALPAGVEPEFVLVSCAGSANRPGIDVADLPRMVAAKRKGEDSLRASGLGYTIIRPGPLVVSISQPTKCLLLNCIVVAAWCGQWNESGGLSTCLHINML